MRLPKRRVDKQPRFYKEPTQETIDKYGIEGADLVQRFEARKKNQRVFSSLAALATGTLTSYIDYRITNSFTLRDAAVHYLGSMGLQGMVLLNVESLQKDNIKDTKVLAEAGRVRENKMIEREEQLTSIIEEAELPLPEAPTE